MRRICVAAAAIAVMAVCSLVPAMAQSRVALVIANGAYLGAPPVATAAADATLVAAALKGAGFDVMPANDLTTQNIGDTIGAFIAKVQGAGANGIVFVYFSGYAVQGNGDDHLVPVDAQINTAADLSQTLPLSTLIKALDAVQSAARIIVLDGARDGGFGKAGGQPVAPGLALTTVPRNFLLAYSAAPDSYAPAVTGANSPYATTLATLLAQPGLDIEQVFKGVRLQVNQATTGAQLPWTTSALESEVKLVAALPAAAAATKTLAPALGISKIAVPPRKRHGITKASMRRMSGDEAYNVAIEQDTLRDYQWFVETHPYDSHAGQVWDIIGNRREGILWRRTLKLDSTRAYWNYLDRYPDGAHAGLARSVLADRGEPLPSGYIAQPLELPPGYYDEATGLADLVPDGFDRPADVFFGSPDTVFVPAPHNSVFVLKFGKKKDKRDRHHSGPKIIIRTKFDCCYRLRINGHVDAQTFSDRNEVGRGSRFSFCRGTGDCTGGLPGGHSSSSRRAVGPADARRHYPPYSVQPFRLQKCHGADRGRQGGIRNVWAGGTNPSRSAGRSRERRRGGDRCD